MSNLFMWTKVGLLVAVYAVVIPGQANGLSFFNGFGKYVESFGEVMSNVVSKVERVIDGVRTFENVITDAIEAECEYKCHSGAKPKPDPLHKPQANGCGSLGLQLGKDDLPIHQLTRCCNDHDVCYDTCNNEKDDCDKEFKKCLYRLCDKHVRENEKALLKRCKGAAKFMFVSTTALGCRPYKDAQQNACLCDRTHREL